MSWGMWHFPRAWCRETVVHMAASDVKADTLRQVRESTYVSRRFAAAPLGFPGEVP
jgi:hypothetical protein